MVVQAFNLSSIAEFKASLVSEFMFCAYVLKHMSFCEILVPSCISNFECIVLNVG